MINRLVIITLLLSLGARCDDTSESSDAPATTDSQAEVDTNADEVTSGEAEPESPTTDQQPTTTNQQPTTTNQPPTTSNEQPTSIAGPGAKKKNKLEGKIVGGVSTDPSEFPSNVQFFNLGSMCGGSVLTVRTIFTAAHCFSSNTDLGCMRVVAGARFVHDPLAQAFMVWEFTIHEKYNKEFVFSNDIAVVMIIGEFQLGPKVQRAVLVDHEKFRRAKFKNFRVAGYGKTEYKQEPFANTKFMKTTLKYVTKKKCARQTKVELGPGVFCLQGRKKGKDTCQGDSGAAVLWRNLTVGVVSFGQGCGAAPGVYVHVFYFRRWLLDAAQRLAREFCRKARG